MFRQITDDTERVDLEGKTLIPGFIESHAHVTDWAECEFLQFTCYHIKNIAELQDMIRENAKTKKAGEWLSLIHICCTRRPRSREPYPP